MEFIAGLNKTIAQLEALGEEDELALAVSLGNCVKEYLNMEQTSDFTKYEDILEEGEVVENGEIIEEEEGELSIKQESEQPKKIKGDICTNDDSKENMFLTMQKITQQGNQRFTCNECKQELTSLNRFIDHKRLKHGITNINEEIKTIGNIFMQDKHEQIKSEHVKPVVSCTYCSFTKTIETSGPEIKIIFRKHIQNEHIMCEVCEIKFTDKYDLIDHIENHNPEEGVYVCNYKGCIWSEKQFSLLFLHAQKVHHAVRLFKCNKCTKSCSSIYDLKMHFKRHSGYRRDVCPLCELSYMDLGRLKTHIKKDHKNKCNVCDRIFKNTTSIFEHMRGHTEKKHINLACMECNKLFPNLSSLKLHKLSFSHTGTKYFSCKLCKKEFSSKTNIAKHMSTRGWSRCKMLPKVNYSKNCIECGKVSKNHSGWLKHMRYKHYKKYSLVKSAKKAFLQKPTL